MNNTHTRVWAKISLDNIRKNYRTTKKSIGDADIMAIIKADAYGHGSVAVANALLCENPNCYFAVAAPCEALELRDSGITAPVLILGAVTPDRVLELNEHNITLAVGSLDFAREYSRIIGDETLKIHITLDTGMSRYGFSVCNGIEKVIDEIKEIASIENLIIEGIFTHFAAADSPQENDFTLLQLERFNLVVKALEEVSINIPIKHCSNSAATLRLPETHFNMVREGLLLYGCAPTKELQGILPLCPAMTVQTQIMHIKDLPAGETIGYGRAYTCETPQKIATVSIGYADGIFRAASGKISMLVNGHLVKQVGSICMDICMLDITGINDINIGDSVTVFGDELPVELLADAAETISYEVLCAINKRVPREYIGGFN